MVVKIKFARPTGKYRVATLALLVAGSAVALCAIVGFSIFGYYYFAYRGIVDQRLSQPIFADTAQIYAAPREVRPGQKLSVQLIANELREAGYTTEGASQPSPLGTYSEGRAGDHGAARCSSPITRPIRRSSTSAGRGGIDCRRQGPAALELRA